MPSFCESVSFVCFGGTSKEVMRLAVMNELGGVIIEKEDEIDLADYMTGDEVRCVIRECEPNPCLFKPGLTNFSVRVLEKCASTYDGDYAIIKCSKSGTYIYYRDFLDRFRINIIEPLLNDEEPSIRGITLVGLPGVGKTEFTRVVANLSGATLINAYGSSVFSKWFGEPEKRLKRLVRKAVRSEPSILVFNDLDNVIANQREYSGDNRSHEAYVSIINELLNQYDALRGHSVVIFFTTNAPVQAIDPAMKRRFEPIVVPPPNREMASKFLSEGGNETVSKALKIFGKDKVVDFFMNIIARGGTWGVAIQTLRESVALNRFVKPITLMETLNYVLLSPERMPALPQQFVNAVKNAIDVSKPIKVILTMEGVKTELTSKVHASLSLFLAYVLGMVNNKHVVMAVNPMYATDAAYMADQINGIALVPGDLSPVVYNEVMKLNAPIIFEYMTDPQQAFASRVVVKLSNPPPDAIRGIYRAIADFYGVPCPPEERYGMNMIDALARYAYIVWSKRKPCFDAYTEAISLLQ